jgi:hypothetical protein
MAGKKFFVVAAALAAGTIVMGTTPVAAQSWTVAANAAIRPGARTVSSSGQCTSNFVFTNGKDVLLGQAAHCTGNSSATSTNGCQQVPPPLPLGSPVEVDGASRPATLVYSSWNAMLASGERDPATCAFNDFALLRLDPADVSKVNPSVPGWGGPFGAGNSKIGRTVYGFGNSDLRQGLRPLSPKVGVTLSKDTSGWHYEVLNLTPGIPGDSGSVMLNDNGAALGIIVTLKQVPPGANGVTDLAHAVGYARTHGMPGLTLVNGTKAFKKDMRQRLVRGLTLVGG